MIKRPATQGADSWEATKSQWRNDTSRTYDIRYKETTLQPFFHLLDDEGKIGRVIVDIGSGQFPLSKVLERREGPPWEWPQRKYIDVDIAIDDAQWMDRLKVRLDLEHLVDTHRLDTRRALSRIAKHLDLDTKSNQVDCRQVDTVVLSEILNYVDFRAVLATLLKYTKHTGRFIIVNMPGRGKKSRFHPRGVKSNVALYEHLLDLGLTVEHIIDMPFGEKQEIPPDELPAYDTAMLTLVASLQAATAPQHS